MIEAGWWYYQAETVNWLSLSPTHSSLTQPVMHIHTWRNTHNVTDRQTDRQADKSEIDR